jgi:hypothetical protein
MPDLSLGAAIQGLMSELTKRGEKCRKNGALIIVDAALIIGKVGLNKAMIDCLYKLKERYPNPEKINIVVLAKINKHRYIDGEVSHVGYDQLRSWYASDGRARGIIREIHQANAEQFSLGYSDSVLCLVDKKDVYFEKNTTILSREKGFLDSRRMPHHAVCLMPILACDYEITSLGLDSSVKMLASNINKLIIHVDIDDTLLMCSETARLNSTMISRAVVEHMILLQDRYGSPNIKVEFHVLTARSKWAGEHDKHPASVKSVIRGVYNWSCDISKGRCPITLVETPNSYRDIKSYQDSDINWKWKGFDMSHDVFNILIDDNVLELKQVETECKKRRINAAALRVSHHYIQLLPEELECRLADQDGITVRKSGP